MKSKTERLTVKMSPAERRMLEHLAMAERVPKAFIVRRLIRDAARQLYSTIEEANSGQLEGAAL
jgi:predicted transcriptional regulator